MGDELKRDDADSDAKDLRADDAKIRDGRRLSQKCRWTARLGGATEEGDVT